MPEPRTLPHNAQAENAVVGGIMLGGREALHDVLEWIDEESLYQPRAQAVFRAMRIVDERGEPIDAITLEAQLRRSAELELVGGIEGLARFDRFATAHNIVTHAKIVAERARVRETVIAAREVAEQGMDPDLENAETYCEAAASRVGEAATAGSPSTYVHAKTAMVGLWKTITERQRAGAALSGCPTGFDQLDEMTDGFQPTDFIVMAARPSMGKTALALNIATNACVTPRKYVSLAGGTAQNYPAAALAQLREAGDIPHVWPVKIFSLEMGTEQLLMRIICAEARVDGEKLRKGGRLMKHEFEALIEASARVSHSQLYIDDTAAPTIDAIDRKSERWADKHCPPDADGKRRGVIMVDYLQLARGRAGVKYQSREEEVSDISRGCKALAKKLKMPVVALAQLNRAVDSRSDHRPQLSDLRESGAIEQDADVIMFIYREERYLPGDATDEQRRAVENKAEVIVGKHRNGPIGTVPLTFLKRHTRFENPAPEFD